MAQATGTLPAYPKHSQDLFMRQFVRLCKEGNGPQKSELTWINGLIGMFLNRFRESEILRLLVFARFERMLPLLQLPFFVNNVKLENFSLGTAGFPILSNGNLHSLSQEGEYIASVDVDYENGAVLSFTCKLNFDFTGFSSLWFDTSLTVRVVRLAGRVQLRTKGQLSDRLWIGFEKKPFIKLDIQPSVSSRAVKWQIISGMIERQIQDSLNDILVLPNTIDIVVPPLILGDLYTAPKPFPDREIPSTFSASVIASKSKANLPSLNIFSKSEGLVATKSFDIDKEDENHLKFSHIRRRQNLNLSPSGEV